MSETFTTSSLNDERVIQSLKSGRVGVIPTDTVYGLVALASNKNAVGKLYNLKKRTGKPGTIIASGVEQLCNLGLKKRYLKPVEYLWPGAVSVVIPCYGMLEYLHLGKHSLAVRVPNHKQLRNLAAETGALQTSSANITGKPGATTVGQAKKYFGDNVAFYVDDGDLSDNKPSTVVRVTDDVLEVLRAGAVKIDDKGGISK